MLDESECKNTGGWFKDPFTGKDIGPDYPRVVTCKSGDKWVQPAVCFQNGNIVKISGRCWNSDERACYKEYRNRPVSSSRERKSCKLKNVESVECAECIKQESNDESEKQVISYNPECAASAEVLSVITECDYCLGISQIAGITYALITKHGSKSVYHIPRSVIPDNEFYRLYHRQ